MNGDNPEHTELLRNIWNQIKQLDRNLNGKIDATNERLDAMNRDLGTRIDATNARLDDVKLELGALRGATHAGFELLARADGRRDRDVEELRSRLERVEAHVGLR